MKSSMALLSLVVAVVVISYIGLVGSQFLYYVAIAKDLVRQTKSYSNSSENSSFNILVLGDSTAYGVGAATPEETTAGRLAHMYSASVENYAVSGAQTQHMLDQMSRAQRERYDLVLVQVGANDVIYFSSIEQTGIRLEETLKELRKKSDHVVLLTAGDIGNAPLWPWPLNKIYTKRTALLREVFMKVAEKNGVAYVDIFAMPDPFEKDEEKYYAGDKLHLSGDGYELWTGFITDTIVLQWPALKK